MELVRLDAITDHGLHYHQDSEETLLDPKVRTANTHNFTIYSGKPHDYHPRTKRQILLLNKERKNSDGDSKQTLSKLQEMKFSDAEYHDRLHVTDQYLTRARSRGENQYASLKRVLGVTLQYQGWQVEQIIFIKGPSPLMNRTYGRILNSSEFQKRASSPLGRN